MARITAKKVAEALKRTRGMVSVAARSLGVSRKTVYNYINRHESVREALDEARAFTTDGAELKLYESIQAGEPWAVQFYLRTQGRDRGYGDRAELEQSGDVTIRVVRD